jgi:hypothetical protein
VADSEQHTLDPDIEWIKKELLEQEGPETAKRKYAKLINLIWRAIPLDATKIKKESSINWEDQKNEAIKCIREAASQLDDPLKIRKIPVLAEHWEEISQEERAELGYPISFDLSDPEILERCIERGLVSYALDQIANAMSKIPSDKFRQAQYHDLLDIDASKIGVRGGTANKHDQGRTKALLVKELADIVPENMENRFGVIARFARYRDPTVTRNYVRSTLMKGHT